MATSANEDGRDRPPEGSGPPTVLVHTRAEREIAVASWLLQAAPDAGAALAQWRDTGSAVLDTGRLFSAVCMPDWLVHSAAGTCKAQDVSAFLSQALDGGPVFHEARRARYYALTPPSAERDWRVESTTLIGRHSALVVPPPSFSVPGEGDMYWSVPMDGPGDLCQAGQLAMVADLGKVRASRALLGKFADLGLPSYTDTYPRHAESVALVRRLTVAALVVWGMRDLVDSALIVASELATNSVNHARGASFRLTITRTFMGVRIAVVDLSHRRPQVVSSAAGEESGRGLVIVDALATKWGTDPLRWGKRVWAQLDVP